MTTLSLGGRFYQSESLPVSAQEAVNCYLNKVQTTSVTKENLFTTPGINEITTAGTNVTNRGSHVFQSIPYVVNGNDLYRINRSIDAFGVATFTTTKVNGAVSIPGTERVVLADNGKEGGQMVIVVPESSTKFNTFIFTLSPDTLVAISDVDFNGPASSVNYIDGFFLFTKQETQRIFISLLRDGLSYLATDVTDAEADPDNVVAAHILNNEPQVFGTQTLQPFQNVTVGAAFPFQSVQGGIQQKGLDSQFAVTSVSDAQGIESMVFLGSGEGETPSIWITDGGGPVKLSTTPIDNEIAKYSDTTISNCFVWSYKQSAAQFVGFHFPDEETFIYDFTSQEWHTRKSLNGLDEIIPYRVSTIMDAYGVLIVGDLISNKIGILDREVFTEFGETIRRRFVTPQIDNEGQPFNIDALELWGEEGVGLSNGQGSDPTVLMSFSKNGGRSFSNTIPRSFGEIGEFDNRTIWNSLGRFTREVCFKFEVSDPVKWTFIKIEAQLE